MVSRHGWLACPAQADAKDPAFVFTKDDQASCPQLAVNVGPRQWRLLNQGGLTRPYSESELRWIAPSALKGRSWTVLDSPLVALAPTRNPGVNWPVETPGLALAPESDSSLFDTVPSLQFKLWPNAPRPATTAASCFDSLAAVGVRGLVSGASVPFGLCRFTMPGHSPSGEAYCGSALTAGRAPDGAWDFAEVNCVTRPMWMIRSKRHPEPAALDFVDSLPGEPVAIAGADLNGDGDVDILIESRHHYPDGMFTQLRAATVGKKGWRISQPLPLSDASGEGEGAATIAVWHLASKRMARLPSRPMKNPKPLAVCIETKGRRTSAYLLREQGHWREWPHPSQVANLCAMAKKPTVKDLQPTRRNPPSRD